MRAEKTDLSTTIAAALPLAMVLFVKLGVPLDSETQTAIVGLVVLFIGYFVGKPSAMSRRLRKVMLKDLPEGDR
jgi:hypothetical protein